MVLPFSYMYKNYYFFAFSAFAAGFCTEAL